MNNKRATEKFTRFIFLIFYWHKENYSYVIFRYNAMAKFQMVQHPKTRQ